MASHDSRKVASLAMVALTAVVSLSVSRAAIAADKPAELRIDYATYNPSSLVLKKFGWLEEDLEADGVPVKWVFSAGSNKANEYISANSLDFGSTAGAPALLARTNGVPLKTVYVASRPEWAQILVPANSPLKSIADLKGRKVAATRGTDPFFLLVRGLREAGVSPRDVEIVALQHADGYLAWTRGNVDAWAALDPFLATALLKDHGKVLYRKLEWNTFCVVNVREEFLKKYPTYVQRVLKDYEKARQWILENPDEAAKIIAEAAKIDVTIAKNQLTRRTELKEHVGIPDRALRDALEGIVPVLVEERFSKPGSDPARALAELIDDSAARAAIQLSVDANKESGEAKQAAPK